MGKKGFYSQIERNIEDAADGMAGAMVTNLTYSVKRPKLMKLVNISDKLIGNLTHTVCDIPFLDSSIDTQNGIKSFLNKQKPNWSHTDATIND